MGSGASAGAPDRPRLERWGEGIWTFRGDPVRFLGLPYALRTTLVALRGGGLFVHSPVQLALARADVEALGRVRELVSPNLLHHLFLGEWKRAFPDARLHAPPGLRRRRPDLPFDAELGDRPDPAWADELDQCRVPGSFFMEEVVFFHRRSRTLILGDLIENHDPRGLTARQRIFARANRMLAPNGTTPLNYRWSFWRRGAARAAVERILAWRPESVIVMHGPCVREGADAFLARAFRWLRPRPPA